MEEVQFKTVHYRHKLSIPWIARRNDKDTLIKDQVFPDVSYSLEKINVPSPLVELEQIRN